FCQRALQDSAFEAGGDFETELTLDDREVIDTLLCDAWRHVLAKADPDWASFLVKKGLSPLELRKGLRPHLGKPYLRVLPEASVLLAESVRALWVRAREEWERSGFAWLDDLLSQPALKATAHKRESAQKWSVFLNDYFADPALIFDVPKPAKDAKDNLLERLSSSVIRLANKKDAKAFVSGGTTSELFESLAIAIKQANETNERRVVSLKVELLHQLNSALPKRKSSLRLLAPDDLLNRLNEALQGPAGEDLAARLREQYPLALIDEFQDTDPIQYAIFDRIYPKMAGVASGSPGDL
ncbi:exodeoxyribonuclease V subunit beta, partial [Salmonella enterica subsp. enterica]|nr:exodeoxyribonuclease V subunit beta [Salmonella enterica subsp. enterica serovar Javiana]